MTSINLNRSTPKPRHAATRKKRVTPHSPGDRIRLSKRQRELCDNLLIVGPPAGPVYRAVGPLCGPAWVAAAGSPCFHRRPGRYAKVLEELLPGLLEAAARCDHQKSSETVIKRLINTMPRFDRRKGKSLKNYARSAALGALRDLKRRYQRKHTFDSPFRGLARGMVTPQEECNATQFFAKAGTLQEIPAALAEKIIARFKKLLPSNQFQAWYLFHHDGLGLSEIAARLSVKLPTVKSWFLRARRRGRREELLKQEVLEWIEDRLMVTYDYWVESDLPDHSHN